MKNLSGLRRRPRLIAVLALTLACNTATGLALPQQAAATAKFSQPVANMTLRAGRTYQIVWHDATPGRQPLRLMKGQATALQQVAQIAIVDGAAGRYDWTVPADLPTDNTYAIALGNPPDTGYTGQFTITGVGPGPAPAPGGPQPITGRS